MAAAGHGCEVSGPLQRPDQIRRIAHSARAQCHFTARYQGAINRGLRVIDDYRPCHEQYAVEGKVPRELEVTIDK